MWVHLSQCICHSAFTGDSGSPILGVAGYDSSAILTLFVFHSVCMCWPWAECTPCG